MCTPHQFSSSARKGNAQILFSCSIRSLCTQQIALISANNKAWKALEREKNKTIEVAGVIADCIESNRQLKDAKDAGKWVSHLVWLPKSQNRTDLGQDRIVRSRETTLWTGGDANIDRMPSLVATHSVPNKLTGNGQVNPTV